MSRVGYDLTGAEFGRLVVLRYYGSDNGKIWECLCKCGNKHLAKTGHLRAKAVTSCGCAQEDAGRETGRLYGHLQATHGMRSHRLYDTYRNMIARCHKPQNHRYADYGGRGISVCDEWRSDRQAFFQWALSNGYADGLQIDHINNAAGYRPDNCRWVTRKENVSNTRKNRFLTWNGQTMTVSDWARALGVRPQAMEHRVNRGWSMDRIFTQPFRGHNVV